MCDRTWEKAMSEWQPIETAPKDGTVVLLYCGGKEVVSARHYANDCWTPEHDMAQGVTWATHWMPLPAPPQTAST